MIPFSILDLAPIPQGATAAQALRNSLDLAQQAERWGYLRYWLAEHHNMPGIASAATAVVICHIAGGTTSIRVGSGGVMLPNHAPLVVAEQFGTLASLYPGRIDLGLGRAPGTDQTTAGALRRDLHSGGDDFPEQLTELQGYFSASKPGQRIRAVPGAALDVPIWLLGSSLFSARLAAQRGLPYAFAAHFAPTDLMEALAIYRSEFHPSPALARPYAMVGVNVLAAESDAAARRLFTSQQQAFSLLLRGTPGQVPPPIDDIEAFWTPAEKAGAQRMLGLAVVGSPETVERSLRQRIDQTKADELILTGHVYNHADRLRSYEMISEIHARLSATE
jgi:luciferase family oxidoreductase group 1